MITSKLDKEEQKKLNSLVGCTIKEAIYINQDEGIYELTLHDGRKVQFSSSGDDMTFTTFSIS